VEAFIRGYYNGGKGLNMAWNNAKPADGDNASSGPSEIRTLKTDLGTALNIEHTFPGSTPSTPKAYHKIPYGNTGSRPAAGYANRWYYNTTTGTIQRDTGATWENITGRVAIIPSGSFMPFGQASAPFGWTISAANNDKLLRVVSGTGGGTGGTWVVTMDSKGHDHPIGTHTVNGLTHTNSGLQHCKDPLAGPPFSAFITISNHGDISHLHANTSSYSHTHTTDGAWRPKYFDVIICEKD
jgi:hypothetical protein